jgi:hypothetical protein
VEHRERIRITAHESDLAIAIEGGAADMMFDAQSSLSAPTKDLAVDMAIPAKDDESGDYVITLEFHKRPGDDAPRGRLARMDIHVRDVSVRLRDSGYVLEAELTGWVGYTSAFEKTVGRPGAGRSGGESGWHD